MNNKEKRLLTWFRMKNIITLFVVVLISTSYLQAQSLGDIRLFGGFTYGTAIEDLGFNIGGEYLFTDNIAGDASYSHYFVGSDFRYAVLNFDGRYYIPSASDFQWYGLFGLAFNNSSTRSSLFSGRRISINSTGVNLGAGFVYPFSSTLGFHVQTKYNTGFSGQLEVQAGISYELN